MEMLDESVNISARTWSRTIENINKVGYSDGVTDGENATYQSSFDMGYLQGLKFGLELGYRRAIEQQTNTLSRQIPDLHNINCQVCLGNTTIVQNVVNLFNTQKEKNDEYLKDVS